MPLHTNYRKYKFQEAREKKSFIKDPNEGETQKRNKKHG